MKRYFDFPSDKTVCKLDILKGSKAEKANVQAFRDYFKIHDAREVTKEEYRKLEVQYCKFS